LSNHRPRLLRRRTLATVAVVAIGAAVGSIGTAGSAVAADGQYIAQYADAFFQRHGAELHLAPGRIDDSGTISEVLEASIHQESCEGRFLVVVDLTATADAGDIPGVEVDARAGHAAVAGTFTFAGDVTFTPAGRGCKAPVDGAAVTSPLTTDVTLDVSWANERGSVPVVYSGGDCGGDGICYYRDARSTGSASSDFFGSASGRTTDAFFFEGTYSASSADVARIPSR
jgi:hypothetical protein